MITTMHDWSLVSICMDWTLARVTIVLKDGTSSTRTLIAEGVRNLRAPRESDWGPSVSVNTFLIDALSVGTQRLQIEMQSGDVIEIVAERFDIPNH
jgi:hypothetical protein